MCSSMNDKDQKIPFIKAEGLGNDFAIFGINDLPVDVISQNNNLVKTHLIRKIADRNLGVGCDQVIVYQTKSTQSDVWFYNADGSSAETCGNGLRCLSLLLFNKTKKKDNLINCLHKNKTLRQCDTRVLDCLRKVSVNMGQACFGQKRAALNDCDPTDLIFKTRIGEIKGYAVNLGNPHVIFFVDNVKELDLSSIAPNIAGSEVFPEGVNVSFASFPERLGQQHYQSFTKTWERGVGLTNACGSGACAVGGAALKLGLINAQDSIDIIQNGGVLNVQFSQNLDIIQTGQAKIVFSGVFYYSHEICNA